MDYRINGGYRKFPSQTSRHVPFNVKSFGKRTPGCSRRPNECLILEPSEMMVIDYPDSSHSKHRSHNSQQHGQISSIELYLGETDDAKIQALGRYPESNHSESFVPAELQGVQSLLQRSESYLRAEQNGFMKRHSRASDTSSAYSGSDMMQSSSVDDQDMDSTSNQFADSVVDSDDEDCEDTQLLTARDTVRECLEREPSERTEDDIETLLEFMQHLPAFANMTLATRRSLCAVMVFAVVEKAGTIVMKNAEELDSWSVILNGHVEVVRPNGDIEHLHLGDSFGITPTMEKLYHKGVMRTKLDDCQFVCIAQEDYYKILHQGEENTLRHEENGQVVMVTEHRVLDGGNRKGHIVIKGTPERLMSHLVEEHSSVDPTYVEDFLLTYRTFLKSPIEVAEKLTEWFNDCALRDRVTRVVLLWVNNHFNDFETDPSMSEFLETFEKLLEKERMGGQLRLLNIACAAKARPRNIVMSRKDKKEILHFSILGGIERGCGIFISKVERGSKAHDTGLKRGDQILDVNNNNFEHISHVRALEILRGTTTLSITVKSNLLAFKEMVLASAENVPSKHNKKEFGKSKHFSVSELDDSCVPPVIAPPRDKGGGSGGKEKGISAGKQHKIRKALMKFSWLPSKNSNSSDPTFNHLDDSSSSYSRGRKSSTSSQNSSPIHTPSLGHSHSNPDLTLCWDESRHEYPEYVIKVFKVDQAFKYLLIHRETTSREIVMLSLQEFGISDPSSNYSLCEVTVENEDFVKTKRLPEQLSNLPDRMTLNARYYVKNNMCTEALVPDEIVPDLIKECQVNQLQLNSSEVAAQLTLRDFHMFHDVEPTEYVDELFELDSKYGHPHLAKFSQLVNKEMFWVITEIVREQNIVKRTKMLKHFIKVARHCKDTKNFNSMFAIISGLGHRAVSRLRISWDRMPSKYIKMFEDLQDLMDPSRNMSKYRNLVNSEMVQPPLIPFFPVVKKDLTFIHYGNDSKVQGLINFEKLRMIAKEVRHTCNMASAQYDLSQMYLRDSQTVFSAFTGMSVSAVATLRRKRRQSSLINPKKMFEEAQMVRRVRSYLQNLDIEDNEKKLTDMSHVCEPPAATGGKKRDPSPGPAMHERTTHMGPKFGAESPEAVRKLMSLSDKVRPHNSKSHPLPPKSVLLSKSPRVGRRPPSPKQQKQPAAVAVALSAEDSSVVSLGNMAGTKKPLLGKTNSKASDSSNSPTNSVGSYTQQETDSGHNSITSSNFDTFSTSSNSPPLHKRHHVPPPPYHHQHPPPPPSSTRPPLPPYHVVVQNNPAYSQYLQQQYHAMRSASGAGAHVRRPPLPDYVTATNMTRRKQQAPLPPTHARSHSFESYVHPTSSFYVQDRNEQLVDGPAEEDEQVSAV